MGRAIILAIVAAALSIGCAAQAPTASQHTFCGAATGLTCTATFGSNVTAGHLIVACEGVNSSGTPSTPTMTGETFTAIAGASVTASPSGLKCYQVASAVGGHAAVVGAEVGCSGCGFHLNIVDMTAGTLDQAASLANSTVSPYTVTSGSTTSANELLLGFYYDDSANATYVAGTGYAILDNNGLSNGNASTMESKTVSATGAQTATVTGPTNGTDSVSGAIMTFKGAAAAGSGGFNKRRKLDKVDP